MMCSRCRAEIALDDEQAEFQREVIYATKIIRERGRIWEGARPAFERGDYEDKLITDLLAAGVIVPDPDPDGGYVLPKEAP